jgi:4-hydroxy-3-methylbut-2-en-1-yl diphosphate reductase
MKITIDKKSGFCFGVLNAIKKAEDELASEGTLYCLGDIVHNGAEVKRLNNRGMKTISREEFYTMKNCRVLIRAHGEPPETYNYARANNIELIDATCPIVLNIQKKIRSSCEKLSEVNGQLVIFGKPGHAEVEGLNGQTGHKAIVIQSKEEVDKIDFSRPVVLYSQTTKPLDEFREIADIISFRTRGNVPVDIKDTVCRQVSNRAPHLEKFAADHEVIVFVSGKKSSNGAVLFAACKKINARSYIVADTSEIEPEWFAGVESVGVCGATSTPQWLMEEVAAYIESIA